MMDAAERKNGAVILRGPDYDMRRIGKIGQDPLMPGTVLKRHQVCVRPDGSPGVLQRAPGIQRLREEDHQIGGPCGRGIGSG